MLGALIFAAATAIVIYAAFDSARYHTPAAEERARVYWADFRVDCTIARDREYRRQKLIDSNGEDYHGPF